MEEDSRREEEAASLKAGREWRTELLIGVGWASATSCAGEEGWDVRDDALLRHGEKPKFGEDMATCNGWDCLNEEGAAWAQAFWRCGSCRGFSGRS